LGNQSWLNSPSAIETDRKLTPISKLMRPRRNSSRSRARLALALAAK
jgi:hypothetical protein